MTEEKREEWQRRGGRDDIGEGRGHGRGEEGGVTEERREG